MMAHALDVYSRRSACAFDKTGGGGLLPRGAYYPTAGDFNINWIDSGKSNCELVKFRRLLNSYILEQFIDVPTHDSDHLIDYIISSADFVTNVTVSDRMSDHYALHCMLSSVAYLGFHFGGGGGVKIFVEKWGYLHDASRHAAS